VGTAVRHKLVPESLQHLRAADPDADTLESVLVDCLWLWSSALDAARNKEELKALAELVFEVKNARLASEEALRVHLDVQLLVDARMTQRGETADVLNKRLTRVRTSLVFKQQKYNLFREETEGYSRLLALLSTAPVFTEPCPASATASADTSTHILAVCAIHHCVHLK
jgi:THO complex subunit 2